MVGVESFLALGVPCSDDQVSTRLLERRSGVRAAVQGLQKVDQGTLGETAVEHIQLMLLVQMLLMLDYGRSQCYGRGYSLTGSCRHVGVRIGNNLIADEVFACFLLVCAICLK